MRPSPKITIVGAERPRPSTRWLARGTTIDYTFYAVQRSLCDILAEAACDELIGEADGLIAFGEYDVSEGGGARPWLVTRPADGQVFAFDVECDAPLRPLNSSISAFVDTFGLLDAILHDGQPPPPNLRDLLRAADPQAFERSEWRLFADYIRAASPAAAVDGPASRLYVVWRT